MSQNISSQLVLLQTQDKVSPHVKKLIKNISPSLIVDETFSRVHELIREGRSMPEILSDDGLDIQPILDLYESNSFKFLCQQDQLQHEKVIQKLIETHAQRGAVVQVSGLLDKLQEQDMTMEEIREVYLKGLGYTIPQSNFTDNNELFLELLRNGNSFLETGNTGRIPSGIKSLDKMIKGGFKRGTWTIVGGGTGDGKSSLAMTLAYNMTRLGFKVLYNNLELNGYLAPTVIQKFIAISSYYEGVDLTCEQIEYPTSQKQIEAIENLYHNVTNKYIPDIVELTNLDDLEAQIILGKYDFCIIDYIGLMDEMRDQDINEYAALAKVSSRCKRIANTRGTSIMGLMQFNKATKKDVEGERLPSNSIKGNDQIQHDCDYYFNINCKYRKTKEQEYDLEWHKDRHDPIAGMDTAVKFIKDKSIFVDR